VRLSKLAAVAAVALVGTAGCSVHPGAAAVVDGRTITQEYTQNASEDLGLDVGRTLSLLIAAPYFIDAAEANGVPVSPEDARAAVEDMRTANGGDAKAPIRAGAIEIMRLVLASQALSVLADGAQIQSDTNAHVLGLKMDINPRYGEMDLSSGLIARPPLPWIVPTDA